MNNNFIYDKINKIKPVKHVCYCSLAFASMHRDMLRWASTSRQAQRQLSSSCPVARFTGKSKYLSSGLDKRKGLGVKIFVDSAWMVLLLVFIAIVFLVSTRLLVLTFYALAF